MQVTGFSIKANMSRLNSVCSLTPGCLSLQENPYRECMCWPEEKNKDLS